MKHLAIVVILLGTVSVLWVAVCWSIGIRRIEGDSYNQYTLRIADEQTQGNEGMTRLVKTTRSELNWIKTETCFLFLLALSSIVGIILGRRITRTVLVLLHFSASMVFLWLAVSESSLLKLPEDRFGELKSTLTLKGVLVPMPRIVNQ